MAITNTIIPDFIEDLGEEIHNFESDNIDIILSNTAPASESSNPLTSGNGASTNVTAISYTNYSDDLTTDRRLESVVWNEASGVCALDAGDVTITASGGTLATFQYVYVYNQTSSRLITVVDLDEAVSLTDGSSRTISWSANGLVRLTIS